MIPALRALRPAISREAEEPVLKARRVGIFVSGDTAILISYALIAGFFGVVALALVGLARLLGSGIA